MHSALVKRLLRKKVTAISLQVLQNEKALTRLKQGCKGKENAKSDRKGIKMTTKYIF